MIGGFTVLFLCQCLLYSYLQEKMERMIVLYGQELFLPKRGHLNCPRTISENQFNSEIEEKPEFEGVRGGSS